MKILKYINYRLFAVLFFAIISCDYLEYDETSFNRKDDVFTDFNRSKSFLTNIYSYLPTDFNSVDGAMRSSATDEAEHVLDLSDIQRFNEGRYSDLRPIDNVWGNMYSGIRAANMFIVETEGVEFLEDQYNESYAETIEQFKNYAYEARFLRAYFYFELVKRYKNIPLITDVLTSEEAINVSQNSFEEVVDFIVNECDVIAEELPVKYEDFSSVGETGRATKGAALALKARMLLYAASPLHNTTGNASLWVDAAEAAKSVLDLDAYTLEGNYADIVNNYLSSELIFERRQGTTNGFEQRNFPIGFEGGNTGTCPTQNLVDAYEMQATGLSIMDPASGYDATNPYAGRDPRLAQTVLVNGAAWKGKTIESFVGGLNGAPIVNATKTGYYLKKYVIEDINLTPTNTTSREHTWVLFRLGEVLLNYAEAMNEAYGPENASTYGMTALDAVNKIRTRANMPNFPSGLSKDEFRQKLQNERMVELAFEDHRFWDVRRWKIGNETTDIYGVKITKDAVTNNFEYEKSLIEVRAFEDRMNLYPIPKSEINKNSNLVQNIGW
ncbi:RagB/SusD family nutrient uptake outer membrane protein [Lutibacter sp. A64]|uniref:RagB/SusD family nutrient uptake outer membrane protein n=1 Tax=Lutibacter sp. A64 TaxID=2918526 RepID=UPI001F058BBC|nr:RagB/SusD family nutrient uptake outer membrane protein [Lutibacter sp. A64]UMB52410.1 RagB/SusD family nutrient uptake outer membrane protein [Lutibacter sp. A64]